MVTGMDINCNIGLTIKLSNANTITTIIDEPKPSTLIPGKKFASRYTITAVTIKLIKILIAYNFNLMLLLLHPDSYQEPTLAIVPCNVRLLL